jgi:hypothetical protein
LRRFSARWSCHISLIGCAVVRAAGAAAGAADIFKPKASIAASSSEGSIPPTQAAQRNGRTTGPARRCQRDLRRNSTRDKSRLPSRGRWWRHGRRTRSRLPARRTCRFRPALGPPAPRRLAAAAARRRRRAPAQGSILSTMRSRRCPRSAAWRCNAPPSRISADRWPCWSPAIAARIDRSLKLMAGRGLYKIEH